MHVHELTHPDAAPLVAALSQPVPTDGDLQDVARLLRGVLNAVKALVGEEGRSSRSSSRSSRSSSRRRSSSRDEVEEEEENAGARSDGEVSKPQPDHSFPLLRRATVARLAQIWLVHLLGAPAESSWAAGLREDMTETLLQLFRLHRDGMLNRDVLEFLHISKAAGTSMCHLAEASKCRAMDFGMGRTCLLREFGDQPRWINASHHWDVIAPVAEPLGSHPYAFLMYGVPRAARRKRSCVQRLAFLKKMNLDFFANEYTVYNDHVLGNTTGPSNITDEEEAKRLTAADFAAYVKKLTAAGREGSRKSRKPHYSAVIRGAHLCSRFASVAVLRDPVGRFDSHLMFIAQTYGALYKWPSVVQAFAPGRRSAAWWRRFSPSLFDNYLLRTLGGEGVFALPHGSLKGEAYMRLARVILAQYDVLVVLEVKPGALQRVSSYGLGWDHVLSEFQLRNASEQLHRVNPLQGDLADLLPEQAVMEMLREAGVQYDSQLYEFGALLSGLDDVVWRMADEVLGEPLPGFWQGAQPRCGYINGREHPSRGTAPARGGGAGGAEGGGGV